MSGFELVIEPRRRPVGSGFVDRLLPYRARRMVGPFIFADLMGPERLAPGSATNIDAHPHIGLSTITYLFSGRMVHRDSTGAVQAIEPGSVNWMTSGSGVTHTERSHPADVAATRSLHGLQSWVALPEDAQEVAPFFEHVGAGDVPVETIGGSSVRVVAGTGWGLQSPVSVSSPLVLAEIRLEADSPVPVVTGHSEVAVLAVAGAVSVGSESVPVGHLAVLEAGSEASLGGTGKAMVLGGEPLGPRHIWWNFVHSRPERIEQAKVDWVEQRFPVVPGDHEPWVPLPGGL
jgi:redox-sensitive bicupin YhaK (pirin superfamily)